MRIVGGKYKGKSIVTPRGLNVRPTTDFAKESLFNILNNSINFEEIKLLELFAGTGNIGFEFASRGCTQITSVELNFNCIQHIKKTNKKLGLKNKVIRSDVFRYIKLNKDKYNFIFADPPYNLQNLKDIHKLIFNEGILYNDGMLVIEHDKYTDFSNENYFSSVRQYGRVMFSFFNFKTWVKK